MDQSLHRPVLAISKLRNNAKSITKSSQEPFSKCYLESRRVLWSEGARYKRIIFIPFSGDEWLQQEN